MADLETLFFFSLKELAHKIISLVLSIWPTEGAVKYVHITL